MKQRIIIISMAISVFVLCGCAKNTEADVDEKSKWDCSVSCAEESKDNSYIITYSAEKVVCTTGKLSIQNHNDFDIIVYLSTNDEDERVEEIAADKTSVLSSIKKNVVYTVGFHADVEENTNISCIIYDGELLE